MLYSNCRLISKSFRRLSFHKMQGICLHGYKPNHRTAGDAACPSPCAHGSGVINFSYSMFLIRRLLCALCLAGSAMAGAAAPTPPNVILITLDTVRADRMGFLGSDRKLTPSLDALA